MDPLRRAVARHTTWWLRLFVVAVVLWPFLPVPWWIGLSLPVVFLALAFVRPPRPAEREPEVVATPVRGRWAALNSPGTKVPSHGTRGYGQAYAIDILHPRPPDAPTSIGWGRGMRDPEACSSFGEPILAVAGGMVVATSTRQRDHLTRESWPALAYMLSIEGLFRELGGVRFVLGNHVVVDHGDGVFAAYAHLRRGSARVTVGDRVEAGQQLGDVGNSGNTSEPHLHVQLMDHPVPTVAAGIPFRWDGIEIPGDVDSSFLTGDAPTTVEPGLPANGQVFVA